MKEQTPPTPLMQRVLALLDGGIPGGLPAGTWSYPRRELARWTSPDPLTTRTLDGLVARGLVERRQYGIAAPRYAITPAGKCWREDQARKARAEERKRELIAEALGRRP